MRSWVKVKPGFVVACVSIAYSFYWVTVDCSVSDSRKNHCLSIITQPSCDCKLQFTNTEGFSQLHLFVITYQHLRSRKKNNTDQLFNPLTPKIWMWILPSSYIYFFTIHLQELGVKPSETKIKTSTLQVWVLVLPVGWIMYWHCRYIQSDRGYMYHFWELKD